MSLRRCTAFGLLAVSVAILASCAAPRLRIRASPDLLSGNPARRVAIFSFGKVIWPLPNTQGSIIDIADSITAIQALHEQAESVLRKKGYEIVASQMVGVGHSSAHAFRRDGHTGNSNSSLEKIVDDKPLFTFEGLRQQPELLEKVNGVISQYERAIAMRRLGTFTPPKELIDAIRQSTDADTICFHRVFGIKYTAARKTGAAFASLLTPVPIDTADKAESHFTFVNAMTGEVLWQHGRLDRMNPLSTSELFMEQVLRHFPEPDQPMDPQYAVKGARKDQAPR